MARAPIPTRSAIAVVRRGPNEPTVPDWFPTLRLGPDYVRWLSQQAADLDLAPQRQSVDAVVAAVASIAVTPLATGDVVAGIWRISATLRVRTPASVSSEIQLSLTWEERGVTQIEVGTNLTGNLTTTREGKTFVIRSDASTPISYSTTYVSVGTPMAYDLDIVAELLAADGQS